MYNLDRGEKIAVLAGGPSSEREISIKSGRAVYNALKLKGCNIKWLELGKNDAEKELEKASFNVAFIALHGKFGEDGTIQRILERMSVPYTGSGVEASRLALDKIASRVIFEKKRMPVPDYIVIEKNKDEIGLPRDFSWPIVVKPQNEGSSIGLSFANNKKQFKEACKKAFKYGDKIIIEKYIKGREITVGILGKTALPVIEIIPKRTFYDYFAKYNDSRTEYKVPASLPVGIYKKAQALGLACHNALGCSDFSRVDMLFGEDKKIYILEINSIPGMTERSLLPKAANSAGIDFGKLCLKLLQLAKQNKGKKS